VINYLECKLPLIDGHYVGWEFYEAFYNWHWGQGRGTWPDQIGLTDLTPAQVYRHFESDDDI